MPTELEREIARLDREAEERAETARFQRRVFNLDALPPTMSHADKMARRTREFALTHAGVLAAEGKITPVEMSRLVSALADEEIGNMDMESYIAARGFKRNRNGALEEVGPDLVSEAQDRYHMDDDPDGPYRNADSVRETARKTMLDVWYRANRSGAIDDKTFGKIAREGNLLPKSLLNERGEPLSNNDEVLGTEMFLAGWNGWNDDNYAAGELTKEDLAGRQRTAEATDPTLIAKRDMQVDEKYAEAWRERNNPDVHGRTPEGRTRIKAENREAADKARRETLVKLDNAEARELMARVEERSAALAYNTEQSETTNKLLRDLQQKLHDAVTPPDPQESLGVLLDAANSNSNQ